MWGIRKKTITRAGTLQVICLLVSCLPTPLKFPEPEQGIDNKNVQPNHVDSIQETQNPALSDKIFELATAGELKSFDEKLIELLWPDQNSEPSATTLSLKDIQFLQKRYLEYLRQSAPKSKTESSATNSLELLVSGCTTPKNEFKFIRDNHVKMYTKMYRSNVHPCYFHNSKSFEDLLNSVMSGKSASLRFEGLDYSLSKITEFPNLLSRMGASLDVTFRVYLAPFIRLYSVTNEVETELPSPFWINTNTRSPKGLEGYMPASHSEILFTIRHPVWGLVEFKIYFSDRGFVFDDEDLQLPKWSGLKTQHKFTEPEIIKILTNAPLIAEGFKEYEKQVGGKLNMAGFGLLGVCNDGTALMLRSVLGEQFTLPFPLLRSVDVEIPSTIPLRNIWQSVKSDLETLQLERDPAQRYFMLRQRFILSYPFSAQSPSPFLNYEQFMREAEEIQ